MSIARNLVKVVCCVCLTGCQTVPSPDANRKADAPPAPTARGQSSETPPPAAGGGVLHLQLSAGGLRERTADAPRPVPGPVIDLPAPDANRIPALQKELVRQLNVKIEDLRAKILALKAQARPTPPETAPVGAGISTVAEPKLFITRIAEPMPPPVPVSIEKPAARPVAHTEPSIPSDAPAASQQEINRLITQCLSDLEKEVRELGERVRALTPPGK